MVRQWLAIWLGAFVLCIGALAARAQSVPGGNGPTLRIQRLQLSPKLVGLNWDQSPQNIAPPSTAPNANSPSSVIVGYSWYQLVRTPTGTGLPFSFTTQTSFDDTTVAIDTAYSYYMRGHVWRSAKTYDMNTGTYYWSVPYINPAEDFNWGAVTLKLRAVPVSAVGTVDSRLDTRFDTPPHQNYPFGATKAGTPATATMYRGGLFAGFALSKAVAGQLYGPRVGRTFLRFDNLIPSGTNWLWPVGGLVLFSPRLDHIGATAKLVTVPLPGGAPLFDGAALTWSTQPSWNNYGNESIPVTLSWPNANTRQWAMVNCVAYVQGSLWAGSNSVQLLLKHDDDVQFSADPPNYNPGLSAGWAYFARPGFTDPNYSVPSDSYLGLNGLGPFLLLATQGSGMQYTLNLDAPSMVYGMGSTTLGGNVSLNFSAPDSGVRVTMVSNTPLAATVAPTTLEFFDGDRGPRPITVTVTPGITASTTVTLYAVLTNVVTKTLSITVSTTVALASAPSPLPTIPVASGGTASGTVTLASAAPTGGAIVGLKSNRTNVGVPAYVTVPAGQTSVSYTITGVSPTGQGGPATITAFTQASNQGIATVTVN
jgi:hypothetical protein